MKQKSFLEKRKWQVALRRYVIEEQPSFEYAPYFGINISGFRSWIEGQFDEKMNWENFGSLWQLEHVIPLQYFNLQKEDELRLCWHFTNIQVGLSSQNESDAQGISPLQARSYFLGLADAGLERVNEMLTWMDVQEIQHTPIIQARLRHLIRDKRQLQEMEKLDATDLLRINKGLELNELIAEKKLFHRFK